MVSQAKVVVVANPIPAGAMSEKLMDMPNDRAAFMASADWAAAFYQTTLSRIWCIGEHSADAVSPNFIYSLPHTHTHTFLFL